MGRGVSDPECDIKSICRLGSFKTELQLQEIRKRTWEINHKISCNFASSTEPKKTRKVLKYLCRLLIFVDDNASTFASVKEEICEKINEKRQTMERLDATITAINQRMSDLDQWRLEIPKVIRALF